MQKIYHFLTYLLPLLLWLNLALPSFSQPTDIYTPQTFPPTTEADYWLETVYGMAGSAAGNGSALVVFLILDLLPSVFASAGEPPSDWIGSIAFLLPLLLLLPIAGSTAGLYFFFPKPEGIEVDLWWTVLGSALSTLLHTLLVLVPLLIIFDQGKLQQTVYTIAPAAFASAVLFEGAGSALFYDQTRVWKLEVSQQGGLILARSWHF